MVKQFGIQVLSGLQIVDESLVHRNGLSKDLQAIENDTSLRDLDPNSFINQGDILPDVSQFDVAALTDQARDTAQRWVQSPISTVPVYEE